MDYARPRRTRCLQDRLGKEGEIPVKHRVRITNAARPSRNQRRARGLRRAANRRGGKPTQGREKSTFPRISRLQGELRQPISPSTLQSGVASSVWWDR